MVHLRSSPKCSIVIRCYNEEQHIGRLLSGLVQQTVQDIEMIVVDSGSTDATVAIASQYPIKLVSIRPEDFSFGRSLNLGCEAATGEFIVIASAHVYPVYKDWLEQLLKPFASPDIALVYGKQRGNEITKYSEHQVFATWFPDRSNPHQSHPFCNNANAAIRRLLWEQVPYDETLTGLEDLRLGQAHYAARIPDRLQCRSRNRSRPRRTPQTDLQPLPSRSDRPEANPAPGTLQPVGFCPPIHQQHPQRLLPRHPR
ncbi:glycosyltransferase family 2 protein [Egbenema bharatensis]|uniref:glycosyltransferase family 2 protein n=1 Tax=Egbenema bharatensis TaxID=3463334 RepID=UPI003A875B77